MVDRTNLTDPNDPFSEPILTEEQIRQLRKFVYSLPNSPVNTMNQQQQDFDWEQFFTANDELGIPQEPSKMRTTMPVSSPVVWNGSTGPVQTTTFSIPNIDIPQSNHMIPDQSVGPSYDPRIGWYFPAIPFTGMATPNQGHTPMTSGMCTPTSAGFNMASRQHPTTMLRDKSKKRVSAAIRASAHGSPESTKDAPLVRHCVCNNKEKVKRPKNAWILYRLAQAPAITRRLGQHSAQEISRIAADQWRNESATVRQKYFAMAVEEKEKHKEAHPDYHYQPGVGHRNKFGSVECTCGAYLANMAALHPPFVEPDDAEANVPLAQRGRPPVAPMNIKRKHDAGTVDLTEDDDEPVTKRRSPRTPRKSIHYSAASGSDVLQADRSSEDQTYTPVPEDVFLAGATLGDLFTGPASGTRSNSLQNLAIDPNIPFDFNTDFDFDFQDNFGYMPDTTGVMFGEGSSFANAQATSDGQAPATCQGSPAMSTRSRAKSVAEGVTSPTTPLRRSARTSTSK